MEANLQSGGTARIIAAKTGPELHWVWKWGLLAISLPLAAGGSTLIGFATKGVGSPTQAADSSTSNSVDMLLLTWGVALLLVSFTCNIVNQLKNKSHARELEAKRGAHLTRFNDELSSVIEVFIELLQSDKDEPASRRFFQSAVREARRLVSYEGVRICVYQLEGQEVDDQAPDNEGHAQPQGRDAALLIRKAYGGRSDPPRPRFTPDTDYGRALIDVAYGTSVVAIDDPSNSPIPTDRNPGAVWSSTLVVPLVQEHEPKGLLMVDTREPVSFTSEDVTIGWTIATIIALGMGSLFRGGVETGKEVAEARTLLAAIYDETPAASGSNTGSRPALHLE